MLYPVDRTQDIHVITLSIGSWIMVGLFILSYSIPRLHGLEEQKLMPEMPTWFSRSA